LGVRSKAQGGEYLVLLNDIEAGEPGREPWWREDDEVGLGENDSSDVIKGGLDIITLPPGTKKWQLPSVGSFSNVKKWKIQDLKSLIGVYYMMRTRYNVRILHNALKNFHENKQI
jgi:hypothetical protein